ncbi:MAG: hypothetical protein M1829_000137 [Trizodia sp. TS-e1964]|nr:MAG: hypothetical protein M1829_000137 [Trizodia sp. TS-e1964]
MRGCRITVLRGFRECIGMLHFIAPFYGSVTAYRSKPTGGLISDDSFNPTGYESEELLNAAGNGDQVAASKVVSLLAKLFPEPKTRPPHKPITPKTPPITPKPWLRPSPYPNAPSILSRPRLSLPGPRHVPILASVCGFPMLRTKTPQSPFLSRMIRFLVARRQRYFDVLSTLEEMQKHAELEDAWDGEMRLHGIVEEGGAWAHDIAVATSYLEGINKAQFRRTLALTRAMQVVVKGERELWEKERAEGKQKKREERLKRRS